MVEEPRLESERFGPTTIVRPLYRGTALNVLKEWTDGISVVLERGGGEL